MSPSAVEYHRRRAEMERDAAARSTCEQARASHTEMAELHDERAQAHAVETAADDLVAA